MTPPQHDPAQDAAVARQAVEAYLANRVRYWERAAQQTGEADARTFHRAARQRLERWQKDRAVDNWVANAVVEAAEQDVARIDHETAAAKVGPATREAAFQRMEAIRRWLRRQGHVLGDDVTEAS